MKVTGIDGDWVGLAYWKGHTYQIDYFSTPDKWTVGFEVVYRLGFLIDERRLEDRRVADGFRKAFKRAFGLSDSHYDVDEWGGSAVYWRVYWDRKGLDLRRLGKCEDNLSRFAEATETGVMLINMTIIPRSLEEISKRVKFNAERKADAKS